MMSFLFILFGKLLAEFLRLTGRQGAALPGYIIERVWPGFLPRQLRRLPEGVIVVSGTNGKTTTTKMLAQLIELQGTRVLTNKTGGNFVRGIIGTIVQAARWNGRLPYDIAVIELDEAYAARFVDIHKPRGAVLLNVMRDQLDRFGEIDTTAKLLKKVADNTQSFVVLNDDDPRLRVIEPVSDAKVIRFGVAHRLQDRFPHDDALYGGSLVRARTDRLVELNNIVDQNTTYNIRGQKHKSTLAIDGPHNAQNAAAAMAAVLTVRPSTPPAALAADLQKLTPAFGRGETITVSGRKLVLQLIKNPAGFRQALHVLAAHKPSAVAVIINDEYADGRDVSWLWDVDFSQLKQYRQIVTGGNRAYDMTNRLKYEDIVVSNTTHNMQETLEELIESTDGEQCIVVFATYTAMLRFRKLLRKYARVQKV